jgi:hypothetical protein
MHVLALLLAAPHKLCAKSLSKIIIDDVRYKKVYSNPEEIKSSSGNTKIKRLLKKTWGNPQTAKEIILSIPLRIKKEKAADYSTVFQFDISGENGGQYTLIVNNGNAKIEEGLQWNSRMRCNYRCKSI